MTKIMLLGDTHGNKLFITKRVIPAAIQAGVRWIYQVGDFGYWEHTEEGVVFLNSVSKALKNTGIELVFIAGNHDKISLLERKYNPIDGFYSIRPGVWFAPNGVTWNINGTGFIALGGAYSIDKKFRLDSEEANARKLFNDRKYKLAEYSEDRLMQACREESAETLWFPEEEMSEECFNKILNDVNPNEVDVILAHDKPYMSNPRIKLSVISETVPNQRRLQKAVNTLQPKLFVHGHLHIRYTDTIRCGDDNAYTVVEGLGADVPNFNQLSLDWRAQDAWEILDLAE
jgi:predicted phosphodiesterase